jgi:hypothetical protein
VELMVPSLDVAVGPPALTTIEEGLDTGQRNRASMATVRRWEVPHYEFARAKRALPGLDAANRAWSA